MKISSGFRPLIRGFFFYDMNNKISLVTAIINLVSVPLFGDSFFIGNTLSR